MTRDKYREMADRINAIKPGMALRIPARDIRDLPGLPDWAFMAPITMGLDRVKESVIGSAVPGLWQFIEEPDGDLTVYRAPEKTERHRPRVVFGDIGPADFPTEPDAP
jgi:hypothetical protein